MKKKVVVGLSGGVDSSVAAYLLKEQGYEVIGLFMHNWEEEDPSCGACSASTDWQDALAVAEKLKIPCYSINFSKEYMERVFSYFLAEYKKGRTPNPDVLCNREIKFGPFLEYSKKLGADYIATGHYARIARGDREGVGEGDREGVGNFFLEKKVSKPSKKTGDGLGVGELSASLRSSPVNVELYIPKCKEKDQTYFLNQLRTSQLYNTIFPLADLDKNEVREIAQSQGLVTAKKKDSTGICFIGERKFKEFLSTYLPATPGDIVDTSGKILGKHTGLMYYTLGQRKGFGLGGVRGEEQNRWFVVKKDLEKNHLVVSCGEGKELFSNYLITNHINYIGEFDYSKPYKAKAKCRYRQDAVDCLVTHRKNDILIEFYSLVRAITPGQYVVIYLDNGRMLGGGVIEKSLTSLYK